MADKKDRLSGLGKGIASFAGKTAQAAGDAARKAGDAVKETGETIRLGGKVAAEKLKDVKLPKVNFDLMDVLSYVVKIPGVRIDREEYLRKELGRHFPDFTVEKAVKMNPARAGIRRTRIDKIADQAIELEAAKVTIASVAASLPGGASVPAAVTLDTLQFFVFSVRIMQKLAYLYGFDELEFKNDTVDDETMSQVVLFLGVMFGVHSAYTMVVKIADALGRNVSKKILRSALSRGVVYPVVKEIAKTVGIRMSKQIMADTAGSVIPVLGGAISGGITLASFRPCAKRLQKCFRNLDLSDPAYYKDMNPGVKPGVDFDFVEAEFREAGPETEE